MKIVIASPLYAGEATFLLLENCLVYKYQIGVLWI